MRRAEKTHFALNSGTIAEMGKLRRYTVEFKRQVVQRMKTCGNIHALARELKIQRKLHYTWKNQLEGRPNLATTAAERKEKHLRDEIAKLQSTLVEKTLENDFLKLVLLRTGDPRPQSSGTCGQASMKSSDHGRQSKAHSNAKERSLTN
jgi:transposase-like protein